MNSLEEIKMIVNEMVAAYERHEKGNCSYDRLLEDVSKIILDYENRRPLIGYVQTGRVKDVFQKIQDTKKLTEEGKWTYTCELHKNDIDLIERILKS